MEEERKAVITVAENGGIDVEIEFSLTPDVLASAENSPRSDLEPSYRHTVGLKTKNRPKIKEKNA